MSGNHCIHRERILDDGSPIWQVQSLVLKVLNKVNRWTMTLSSADGTVRLMQVDETTQSESEKNKIDASALKITCSHILLGMNQVFPSPSQKILGYSQCQIIRNYVGEDDMTGDIVIVALDFTGMVRVWIFQHDQLTTTLADDKPTEVHSDHEFLLADSTGISMALCPPNLYGHGDIVAAFPCLDGSIAMVALGISTPMAKKPALPVGSIIERCGSGDTPLSICWHPLERTLAVGRSDGLVDIIPLRKKGHCRLTQHSKPVRTVQFTPDGSLLVTCCDGGFLAVWDVGGKQKTLVHHVVNAHSSWILDVVTLPDSRKFVTSGADGVIHVWKLDAMITPAHTFHTDHKNWTVAITRNKKPERLVSGSEDGWVQVFSLDS
jgi:WD40 repeat protein